MIEGQLQKIFEEHINNHHYRCTVGVIDAVKALESKIVTWLDYTKMTMLSTYDTLTLEEKDTLMSVFERLFIERTLELYGTLQSINFDSSILCCELKKDIGDIVPITKEKLMALISRLMDRIISEPSKLQRFLIISEFYKLSDQKIS